MQVRGPKNKVFHQFDGANLQSYAMKISYHFPWHPETVKMLYEIRPHPHIVQVLHTTELERYFGRTDRNYVILMELCSVDLRAYLKETGSEMRCLTRNTIYCILSQIVDGLSYCHSKKVTHGNLKSSNGKL